MALNFYVDPELLESPCEPIKICFRQGMDRLPKGLLAQCGCDDVSRKVNVDFLNDSVMFESPMPPPPPLGTKRAGHPRNTVNVNILFLC